MTKMIFTKEQLDNFQSLEEFENDVFTCDEIKEINEKAAKRSAARQQLSDELSRAMIKYMADNNLGFNQFKKKLNLSSTTLSKILKAEANITFDTLADISEVTGLKFHIM